MASTVEGDILAHLLDRRRLAGFAALVGSAILLASALALAVPGPRIARAGNGTVFLIYHLSVSFGGKLPAGSVVTVTAAVTNSSTGTVGDATPTISVDYVHSAVSFLSNAAGWSCSDNAGTEVCTDGTLTPGGSTSAFLMFSVTDHPGYPADFSGGVNDATNTNSGNSAQFTDFASVEDGASYTKDAKSNAFPNKLGTDFVVSNTAAQTVTATDGSVTLHLAIPANALQVGTHLAIYKGSASAWSSSLSSRSQSFVDGYAVGWTEGGQSTPSNASGSLTLNVTDPAARSGDPLYRAATSGVGTQTGTAGSGSWRASFTEDPGFVLAQVIVVTSSSSSSTSSGSSSSSATSTHTPGLPGAGRMPATLGNGGFTAVLILAGVCFFLVGAILVGARRQA